jgi:hypothetical protein
MMFSNAFDEVRENEFTKSMNDTILKSVIRSPAAEIGRKD